MQGKELAYWLADKIPAYGDYAKQAADVLRKQADEIERLRTAIQHALDDEESGTGWGPDVTVCGYLQEALVTPNAELSGCASRSPA